MTPALFHSPGRFEPEPDRNAYTMNPGVLSRVVVLTRMFEGRSMYWLYTADWLALQCFRITSAWTVQGTSTGDAVWVSLLLMLKPALPWADWLTLSSGPGLRETTRMPEILKQRTAARAFSSI